MDSQVVKEYYSRDEIKQRLLSFAHEREIAVMYDKGYGKRPDVIESISDITYFINKGAYSFHSSEERWLNPLLLGTEKTQDDRTKNRTGWDLILDLDGVSFEYSKIVGEIIITYFEELGIKNFSAKFSGNKGFHIGLPFECFSTYHGLEEMRTLFPQLAKECALFLMYTLREKISKALIKYDGSIENIAKKYNLNLKEITNDDPDTLYFDFMKVIEIDTILITSRHLFRMPYSLHEKSGLVSIPIHPKKIREFDKKQAQIENINPSLYTEFEFLSYNSNHGKDGDKLLALIEEPDDEDFIKGSYIDSKSIAESTKGYKAWKNDSLGKLSMSSGGEVFEISGTIPLKDIPKTIEYTLKHAFEDGKKRALFLLLTYFYSINWEKKEITEIVNEWNKKNPEPLKQNYLQGQINWFENQSKKISPPRFDNDNYFRQIGIPQEIIDKDVNAFSNITVKTPLHHTFLLLKSKKK